MEAPSLDQLQDIILPAPPPTDPAYGLLLVALLATGLILVVALVLRRRFLRAKARRDWIQALLAEPPDEALAAASAALRAELMERNAEGAATATGETYLRLLDRHIAQGYFLEGPGRLLGTGLYAPSGLDRVAVAGFLAGLPLFRKRQR